MTEVEPEPVLLGIELLPDGIALNYALHPHDIRKNGLLWQHQVMVPSGSDYDDELEAVVDAINALLADVLEDQHTAEAIDPTDTEDEEDDD